MKQPLPKPQFTLISLGLCLLLLVVTVAQALEIPIIPDPTVPPEMSLVSNSHYIWEQPPIEWDPLSKTPLFCGWDQPSYVEEIPDVTTNVQFYAMDNFRCVGPMPITSIHWWGSYQGWQGPTPPTDLPDAWRITFSGTAPGDPNRPGTDMKEFDVEPDRVSAEWAAFDHFPDKPADSCFEYSLTLDAAEYFWPSSYDDDVFWITIVAVYKTRRPDHAWGWKTRPEPWLGGAWQMGITPPPQPAIQASAAFMGPITGSDSCGRTVPYDMSFALDTDLVWIKAERPFTGLRDWAHYEDEVSKAMGTAMPSIAFKWQQQPDMTTSGQDVDITADTPKTWDSEILADDFKCTNPGPITSIDVWGSWYLNALPSGGAGDLSFTLSIREDVPASGSRSYSTPGKVLWTKTFTKGQFSVQTITSAYAIERGYSSTAAGKSILYNNGYVYKYTFSIGSSEAFVQAGTDDNPVIYWLSVQAQVTHGANKTVRLGWKTSASTWNDDVVWAKGEEPYTGTWQKWSYPSLHPRSGQKTALAFAITTSSFSYGPASIEREVADDWESDDSSPVVAMSWWGSYQGYTYKSCACNDQAEPVRPAYFLLSIWSNIPDPDSANPRDFSQPGQKLWEYKATEYEEISVGFDKEQANGGAAGGHEAVFRYSVQLPTGVQFSPQAGETYWLSVTAVYGMKAANYPWGWTNHEHVFGGNAVAGTDTGTFETKVRTWQALTDETSASEDMSFILFQQGYMLGEPPLR